MSQKRDMMEAELIRIEGLLGDLDKDWSRVRYAWALLALAIPAYLKWGTMGWSLTLLGVLSFVGTAYYLIGVRKAEYRGEMEELRLGMERLRHIEGGVRA